MAEKVSSDSAVPTFVEQIEDIETHHGGHGDRENWVLNLFNSLFGLSLQRGTASEVYLGRGVGRADVLVQEDVVIEVKTNLIREEADAEHQLTKYFGARESLSVAVATDGWRWRFYVKVRDQPRLYHELVLSPGSSDPVLKEALLQALQPFRRTTPSPIDALHLCETLKVDTPTFRLSTSLLHAASAESSRYRVERRAWIAEFSEVYPGFEALCKRLGGDNVEVGYDRLFVRHTYLVVIAKLLAAIRVYDEASLLRLIDKSPGQVLSGEALNKKGIGLSDPDDYFSWVGNPSEELRVFIRELFLSLVRYDFSQVDEDVFRLLYEEVIDADTRHGIGEFYTPRWLAQFITQIIVMDGEQVVLDPACGSGTFLVESIRTRTRLRKEKRRLKTDDLEDLVDQTWGFDINPLAVLLSRVNLYLTVTRIAERERVPTPASFRFHVYTADSLSRVRSSAHRARLQEGSGYFLTMAHATVPVPSSVSTLEDALKVGRALGAVCEDVVSRRSGGQSFQVALASALELAPNSFRSSIKVIVTTLRDALDDGDGIWGLVYRNKVVPLFSRTFDCVIGNPPWLVFREMDEPVKDIANFILAEWDIRPHPKVKSHFDLAVAFALASSNYLKPGGRLGFVLPRSLVGGLQHLQFLEKSTNGELPLTLDEIHDLQGVSPPPFPHGIPCVAAFFHNSD
jgi:hypothetical protein